MLVLDKARKDKQFTIDAISEFKKGKWSYECGLDFYARLQAGRAKLSSVQSLIEKQKIREDNSSAADMAADAYARGIDGMLKALVKLFCPNAVDSDVKGHQEDRIARMLVSDSKFPLKEIRECTDWILDKNNKGYKHVHNTIAEARYEGISLPSGVLEKMQGLCEKMIAFGDKHSITYYDEYIAHLIELDEAKKKAREEKGEK